VRVTDRTWMNFVVGFALILTGIGTYFLGTSIPEPRNEALVFVESVSTVVIHEFAPAYAPSRNYVHPHAEVQRWFRTAMSAGWSPSQWPKLSCIIWRESGGQAHKYNPERHVGTRKNWGSYGLTQLYARANRDWLIPFVKGNLTRLYQAYTNLAAAKHLYDKRGWAPWRSDRKPC
jgi:hypothetical protein